MRARRLQLFALCGLLALFFPGALGAVTISPDDYRGRLAAIDARLRAGDWVGARAEAGRLAADRIAFGGQILEPDLSVLQPLADARDARSARAVSLRLGRLIAALEAQRAGKPEPAGRSDPRLLDEVRARETVLDLPKGQVKPADGDDLLDVLFDVFDPVRRWTDDLWQRIKDWWQRLFPDAAPRKGLLDRLLNLPVAVTLLVVALALAGAWLAARALRQRRRRQEPAPDAAAPPPPAADDDPLSREAGEWERYARELAAAGRHREAVRAWYHAVLVALFRTGALHHRKGRTNWEYVSALAPGYAWRSRFAEMTRCFEREWYGRDRSTPEALHEAAGLARSLLDAFREAA
jgi:Domain of unknown function (DUF4129)